MFIISGLLAAVGGLGRGAGAGGGTVTAGAGTGTGTGGLDCLAGRTDSYSESLDESEERLCCLYHLRGATY